MGHWLHGEFCLEQPGTGRRVKLPEFCCQLLALFSQPRTFDDAIATLPAENRSLVRGLLRRLRVLKLLRPADAVQQQEGRWANWGPVTRLFHFSTRDMDWLPSSQQLSFEQAHDGKPMPLVETTSSRLSRDVQALPRASLKGAFPRVLKRRRSWRSFGKAPVPLAALARALDLSFGVRAEGLTHLSGPVKLKTSPSPGATQSLEAYVVSLNVESLSRGVYWYDSNRHQLRRIKGTVSPKKAGEWLSGQWWFERAGFIVLLTGVLERIQHRYEYPRAYRSWLMEAGHVCQTFCLTATWLNLAPFCTQALADSQIEEFLGIDSANETVLYAMGAGTRPVGTTVGAWPVDHLEGNPYVPAPPTARRGAVSVRRAR